MITRSSEKMMMISWVPFWSLMSGAPPRIDAAWPFTMRVMAKYGNISSCFRDFSDIFGSFRSFFYFFFFFSFADDCVMFMGAYLFVYLLGSRIGMLAACIFQHINAPRRWSKWGHAMNQHVSFSLFTCAEPLALETHQHACGSPQLVFFGA